jgi:hypothetical protein
MACSADRPRFQDDSSFHLPGFNLEDPKQAVDPTLKRLDGSYPDGLQFDRQREEGGPSSISAIGEPPKRQHESTPMNRRSPGQLILARRLKARR